MRHSLAFSQNSKQNYKMIAQLSIPSCICPSGMQDRNSNQAHVAGGHCNIVHNSQKVEAAQLSIFMNLFRDEALLCCPGWLKFIVLLH